jgi:hypothetical protein
MLPEFAQSLYQRFDREGIPLLLAGGWAVSFHGYSRYTRDVDWICSRGDEGRAITLMERIGFKVAFQAMATRFQLAGHPEVPPVDLLWVSPETFAKMALTDQRTGLHDDIPVIDFESLLAMKLHALKDQDERGGRDMLDLRMLLKMNPRAIPAERLRELCEHYASPEVFQTLGNEP